MRWSEVRSQLLPRSGVGVVGPWLVIAPPENPVIRIDLRLIDAVELVGSKASVEQRDLLLSCGGLEVAIFIADGPEASQRLARACASWTRTQATTALDNTATIEATIADDDPDQVRLHDPPTLAKFVVAGSDPVLEQGNYIRVGRRSFRISEVREYAVRGANLPLEGGGLLQAAMAMCVVAAAERDAELREPPAGTS